MSATDPTSSAVQTADDQHNGGGDQAHDEVREPQLSGADLARTALRAAQRAARTSSHTLAKRKPPTAREIAQLGRDAREPAPAGGVIATMADIAGWATGTARGTLHDKWAIIVGDANARHWTLAGFDVTTSTLRILADTPAWATQLRLHQRDVLRRLEQHLPAGSVRALDVRVGRASSESTNLDDDPHYTPLAPALHPAADSSVYRQLRQQMTESTADRQAAIKEAAAEREEILRRHYNRLREPETTNWLPVEEDLQLAAVTAHAREQRQRHRGALLRARAERAGATPLPTARRATKAPATAVRGAA
ncbi:DciA family protein [Kitasatospora sp. NPDC001540]|uniref:DciA family protein n=1 Tax=Kitasatospora sp. NPDC001540 TaxID=3364014 RepID=UPI0036BA9659